MGYNFATKNSKAAGIHFKKSETTLLNIFPETTSRTKSPESSRFSSSACSVFNSFIYHEPLYLIRSRPPTPVFLPGLMTFFSCQSDILMGFWRPSAHLPCYKGSGGDSQSLAPPFWVPVLTRLSVLPSPHLEKLLSSSRPPLSFLMLSSPISIK